MCIFFYLVREMFRRNDRNSIPLLEIITQQCLETVQIMVCILFLFLTARQAGGPILLSNVIEI